MGLPDGVENRRAFFRIDLSIPMCGQLTILEVDGVEIKKGYTTICIEDIGVGGVRFKSKLDIPKTTSARLGIKFKIYDKEYLLPATVVWKSDVDKVYKRYGCRFEILDSERENYLGIFNRFSISCARGDHEAYTQCNIKRCSLKLEGK